jgi:DNA polymerase
MFIGEAPGDQEDQAGLPFVGPAGAVFDRALEAIGFDRTTAYVTNAVKHFKWSPRGKRRIHETPRASEIRACRPWVEAEIDAVRPSLIVPMGSTAVQSTLGPATKVLANRGRVLESDFGPCLITVHPSSILRVPDPEKQEPAFEAFVADLRKGIAYLEALKP